MAKKTGAALVRTYTAKPRRKRKGVHAKKSSSKNKASTNYSKPSRGQGSKR